MCVCVCMYIYLDIYRYICDQLHDNIFGVVVYEKDRVQTLSPRCFHFNSISLSEEIYAKHWNKSSFVLSNTERRNFLFPNTMCDVSSSSFVPWFMSRESYSINLPSWISPIRSLISRLIKLRGIFLPFTEWPRATVLPSHSIRKGLMQHWPPSRYIDPNLPRCGFMSLLQHYYYYYYKYYY